MLDSRNSCIFFKISDAVEHKNNEEIRLTSVSIAVCVDGFPQISFSL